VVKQYGECSRKESVQGRAAVFTDGVRDCSPRARSYSRGPRRYQNADDRDRIGLVPIRGMLDDGGVPLDGASATEDAV
jgi:hypothetical protein